MLNIGLVVLRNLPTTTTNGLDREKGTITPLVKAKQRPQRPECAYSITPLPFFCQPVLRENTGIFDFSITLNFRKRKCGLRASAKNNYSIFLVLWPVYCVTSSVTYHQYALVDAPCLILYKTGEPKYGAILRIYFLPRP